MKKIFFIAATLLAVSITACKKSDFEDAYADPSKISTTSVDKQFAGFVSSNLDYVMYKYWNYFVVLRTTIQYYTQSVGWQTISNQYVPGAASITDRWNNYYNFVAQYRELQNIYSKMTPEEQADRRIYMIAAAIYFYDHTEKVVDLHGDIPWSEAGMLSTNGGDYAKSYAKYDDASAIYASMLDDLKGFATELNSIEVKSAILTAFKNQDLINKGNLEQWKRYCNSLRLRMLTRVSGASDFASRSTTEIGEILSNPGSYPVVSSNDENIKIDVYNLNTPVNSSEFQSGLEDWNGNIAGKAMIDHMNANADPRLRAIFEPGINAGGVYKGLDPMLDASAQLNLINGGTMSIYNRSTISRNKYFPGILINAAEVSFLTAEYYLKQSNDAAAKTAYENGISQSVNYYYWLRTLSSDNTAGALTPTSEEEISAYISSPAVNWSNAESANDKLSLIATQKWLHYNVVQPIENWSEIRRLDMPVLTFPQDNSNPQKQPPLRWVYPAGEATYNGDNYSAVQSKDNLNTKIFWDTE